MVLSSITFDCFALAAGYLETLLRINANRGCFHNVPPTGCFLAVLKRFAVG